jgi:hypothetical protein
MYFFLPPFSTNYSSILSHLILPSISWSTSVETHRRTQMYFALNNMCLYFFLTMFCRHWRSSHRSHWAGELSAHGTSTDRAEGFRSSSGTVFVCSDKDQEDIPHADRWRTVDAATLHGTKVHFNPFLEPDSIVSIVTKPWAGRQKYCNATPSRIKRFISAPEFLHTSPGTLLISFNWYRCLFHRGHSGWDMKLNAHCDLESKLRKCGSTPQLPPCLHCVERNDFTVNWILSCPNYVTLRSHLSTYYFTRHRNILNCFPKTWISVQ